LLSSLPATPGGNGWIDDSTTLEGQTVASGATWTFNVTIDSAAGSNTYDTVTLRPWKWKSGPTYTSIGSIVLNNQTVGSTKTTLTFTTTGFSAVSFATGEKIYWEVYPHATNWAVLVDIDVYESSSGTAGVDGDMQVTFVYAATGGAKGSTLALLGVG